MIIKVQSKAPDKKDSFRHLAQYIANVKVENSTTNEKLEDLWAVNCYSGDGIGDINAIINEVEATQNINDTSLHKTYHIEVSFKPKEKPSLSQLQDIERNIAKTLGFDNHQAVIGTHINTDHYHMHIAYNMINPDTYKKHTPYQAFPKLQKLAHQLEKKHKLYVIPTRIKKLLPHIKSKRPQHYQSRDYEAHTWRQSFLNHCKELKPSIDYHMQHAKNWQDVHRIFGEHNLQIKKRGNGLVITQLRLSKTYPKPSYIKASDFGRRYSKNQIEKRLQSHYQPISNNTKQHIINNVTNDANANTYKKTYIPYIAKPLYKHRDKQKNNQLWQDFCQFKPPSALSPTKKLPKEYRVNSWKQYIMMLASTQDPLALAVLASYKMLIKNNSKTQKSTYQLER